MKYILYCRKSTDSEDRQVLSLDSQQKELMSIAEKLNLGVVKIFRESKTAKEAGRPLFAEMISMLATGKAEAILCWKLDRLARNFIDGGLVMDMLQKSIIKEIRTYEAVHLPNETAFILAMQFGMANQYSRDLSVNVKRGNRAKLEKGEWPNRAPFGYLNDRATKQIIIDPINSKYVVRAFQLYSTGSYGFKEISEILYNEGLRTGTGEKFFSGNIHRFIDNPFYCGLMSREGKLYQGKHQPLISKDLFDQTQDVLHNRNRPRPKTHFFPLRGFLKCENCGCSLTASLKKGHHYYYCTNSKGVCNEHKKYMREKDLYKVVANIFDEVKFDEEAIEIMYESAKEKTDIDTSYLDSTLKTLGDSLNSLKTKESRLLDTFLAEQISKEIYDEKILQIYNDRVSLNKQITDTKKKYGAGVSTLEPTKKLFLRASRAKKEFLDKDDYGKREIIEKMVWNLSFKNQIMAQQQFKSPYDLLAKTPKNADFETMRRR